MNEEQPKKDLKYLILEKIKTGQTKMKPKWHFILKTGLLILGLVIAVLTLLYLASFVLFILRQTGAWFLPTFGLHGIFVFLISLPWLLILIGIIFVVLLELLVRRYSFGWRKPLLYPLIAIIFFVTASSLIVSRTTLHQSLFLRARTNQLPIAGQLYRNFGIPQNRNAHIGLIAEMINEGFRMETPRGEILKVIVTSETSFPAGTDFQKNDRVMVLGQRDDHTIEASGIRRIDDQIESMDENMMRERPPRPHGWLMPPLPNPPL
jgi:hypothetical protein